MEEQSVLGNDLKALRSAVLQIARQKANKIMQEASSTIASIERDLEQKRKFLQESKLAEIEDGLAKELTDVKTAMAKGLASSILEYKQAALTGIIAEAKDRFCRKMQDEPGYYYGIYLAGIVKKIMAMLALKEYFIVLNRKDAEHVKKTGYLKEFGKNITVRDTYLPDDEIGCVIEDKAGTIKIDQRLSKKIDTNQGHLKTKLAPILFSE